MVKKPVDEQELNVDYTEYSNQLKELNRMAWLSLKFENGAVKIPANGENCTREKEFRENFSLSQMAPLLNALATQVQRDAPTAN